MKKNHRARRIKKKKEKSRKPPITDIHHLFPRSRGGKDTPENRLKINYIKHHHHWHAAFQDEALYEILQRLFQYSLPDVKMKMFESIFSNRSLFYIIKVLIRLSKMKHYERVEPKIVKYY